MQRRVSSGACQREWERQVLSSVACSSSFPNQMAACFQHMEKLMRPAFVCLVCVADRCNKTLFWRNTHVYCAAGGRKLQPAALKCLTCGQSCHPCCSWTIVMWSQLLTQPVRMAFLNWNSSSKTHFKGVFSVGVRLWRCDHYSNKYLTIYSLSDLFLLTGVMLDWMMTKIINLIALNDTELLPLCTDLKAYSFTEPLKYNYVEPTIKDHWTEKLFQT